jgi:uncharacterized membrane protein YhaH (DUF805 family)
MMGLFSFSGRTTRLGYLGVGAVQFALLVVIVIGAVIVMAQAVHGAGSALVGGVLAVIVAVAVTGWIGLAATVRRLRDMGWPIGYGMAGLVLINMVGRAAIMPLGSQLHALPQGLGLMLMILGTCGGSMILLFWPSARSSSLDDIEAIFGGSDLDPQMPPFTPHPTSHPTFQNAPQPEPAFARPAFSAPRIDPSQPRAQFGLRGMV